MQLGEIVTVLRNAGCTGVASEMTPFTFIGHERELLSMMVTEIIGYHCLDQKLKTSNVTSIDSWAILASPPSRIMGILNKPNRKHRVFSKIEEYKLYEATRVSDIHRWVHPAHYYVEVPNRCLRFIKKALSLYMFTEVFPDNRGKYNKIRGYIMSVVGGENGVLKLFDQINSMRYDKVIQLLQLPVDDLCLYLIERYVKKIKGIL